MDVDSGAIYRTPEEVAAAQAEGRDVVPIDPELVEALDALRDEAARLLGRQEHPAYRRIESRR